jgi:hypothetical protein
MKYRARVVFRIRALPGEFSTYWHAPRRMSGMVSGTMHSWVGWEGSMHDAFNKTIRKVKA